ncbi:MAG: hypothetical protein JWM75_1182 [Sphingomonas bacterium]|nr:hypothetical protein [Sphingomonas bacterium]
MWGRVLGWKLPRGLMGGISVVKPGELVELKGIEPLTSAVRLQRSPI